MDGKKAAHTTACRPPHWDYIIGTGDTYTSNTYIIIITI